MPQALGLTIPMALLVGLLIGLGRLSADREAVALLACGVSPYRLLRPVMRPCRRSPAAATLYVMLVAIPDANQTFREITLRRDLQAGRERHPAAGVLPGLSRLGALPTRRARPGQPGWKDVLVARHDQADQATHLPGHGAAGWSSTARSGRSTSSWRTAPATRPTKPGRDRHHPVPQLTSSLTLEPGNGVSARSIIQRGLTEKTIAELAR